jgi:hypothetical protein
MNASIQSVVMALIIGAGLSSCATTSEFGAKVGTWKGESADQLVQAWGQPDAIEPLHTGNKMYVYARLRHDPVTYPDFERSASNTFIGPHAPRTPASADTGIYIRCSTYFEVTRQNLVSSVMFRGDDCK